MKVLKIILLVIGIILAGLIVFSVIYILVNKQGVIESQEFNSPDLEAKVLIASQGSDFKIALVGKIVTELGDRDIYVKVIDVTTLATVNEQQWNFIIIINAVQMQKLQKDAKAFIDSTKSPEKVIMLATSGTGETIPEGTSVDVIATASEQVDLEKSLTEILVKLDRLLTQETNPIDE